jgi:hypothetical protein
MFGAMTNACDDVQNGSVIIPTNLAIRAMRDSGYRNTAHALAELIDNSVQATATTVEVFCIEEMVSVNGKQRRRVTKIAVLDNGTGMPPEVLRMALQFGNGTHLNDRSGIGRFGIGLPNASISQGKRVDIWTWQSGPDNAIYSYLDVDEIEKGQIQFVPEPEHDPIPSEWRNRGRSFGTTGSLVVWSNFDDQRLTWKSARATLENTEWIVGRIYRKYIHKGDLRIQLRAFDGMNILFERDTCVNDPLYQMAPSSTPAPFNNKPMFEQWGEDDQVFDINFKGTNHKVIVRASWANRETLPEDGTDRGSKDYGKHAGKNIGVSIVRADRELVLDPSWAIGYDPVERWWGIEVNFPPELDEIFGVTNNKQAATIFSHMVNFDWKTEADPGEEYLDFKRRISEEGDHRADLLDIVNYIRTILSRIRSALSDQTKGRRSGAKRHDDTSVEDRASTKFKERARSGHEAESDSGVFDKDAQNALLEDLVTEKNYEEDTAKQMVEATLRRGRNVIFIESASEMDAFFSVEQKPGGITQVIFNSSHPAYDYLIKTLESDTTEATDKELIGRIQNASDTIWMLFAAWARQEIEDMPGREKLRRMRHDWGRMARDFLSDDTED